MPILNVLDVPFLCVITHCAACGAVRSVPMTSLELGTEFDKNLIALPLCSCGAQEFLNRTFDEAPEVLADHRKKVNAIAIALKSYGRVHSLHSAAIGAEKNAPVQVGDLLGPVTPIMGLPDMVLPPGMKLPS